MIVADGRINEMQREVSGLITRTIATQSPVARDLRFLLSLDHVGYELERMGDHAASVAKQVRKLAPDPPLKRYVDLPAMGELAAIARRTGYFGPSSTSTSTPHAPSPPVTTRSTCSTTAPSTRSSP